MSHFAITRDRDAWAIIRGFVYQVELIIDRWLRLQPDQVLELERGEDIDTIQRAMSSVGDEQARLLEQIKVRANNLTLRSDAARAALASFFEHYQANSASTLSFRYVTNARIGTERNSPAPDRTPLIVIWEQIRTRSIDRQQETIYLRIIRDFLASTSKPSDLNDETWDTFTEFIVNAPDSEALRLIRNVEWLTAQVDTTDISKQLQSHIARQYMVTSDQADNIYSHLFFDVFKHLSTPGIKQLTNDELAHRIALPTLSASDQALLNHLSVFIKNLAKRVETLEGQMSDLQQQRMVEINSDELRGDYRSVTVNSINKTTDPAWLLFELDRNLTPLTDSLSAEAGEAREHARHLFDEYAARERAYNERKLRHIYYDICEAVASVMLSQLTWQTDLSLHRRLNNFAAVEDYLEDRDRCSSILEYAIYGGANVHGRSGFLGWKREKPPISGAELTEQLIELRNGVGPPNMRMLFFQAQSLCQGYFTKFDAIRPVVKEVIAACQTRLEFDKYQEFEARMKSPLPQHYARTICKLEFLEGCGLRTFRSLNEKTLFTPFSHIVYAGVILAIVARYSDWGKT
jgi:hypothetical protein